MNIPEGSVKVTAGGIPLQENKDYTVDYQLGRVKILNSGLLESGRPINISLESNTLYNMQTKTMIGTHLNYQFNDKFHIGGTILNLTERPLTKKVDFGNEPISNTMYGFNGSYSTESQFLTTMVDKIPFIDAKQPSSVTVSGEFAHLIPGHSRAIEKEGNAYIDDFEASETEIDVKSFPSWVIASTPQYIFPEASLIDSLAYNYNRAMFAWYVIDPLFLRNKGLTPNYMRNNPEYQCSHFVREIYQQEIFPERNPPSGMPSNIPVLNLAYYPMQKGPYNYDAASSAFSSGVDENGLLNDPETRWGGIMRELPTTDFEEANIQYIDFWLMDPFVENKDADGGQLYFNLGEISEDILKDSRKMFEQGLPPFGTDSNDVIYTSWGRIPDKQALVNAFQQEGREYQDVGLDGLDNEHERTYFQEYLEELDNNVSNVDAYNFLSADPSSDDFFHYRNQMYDDNKATILQRYKYYNGLEGNSPDYTGTGSDFNQSASTLPDIEDINRDNTLNKGQEAYFEYMVNITPDSLKSGMNFITDSVRTKNKEDQCSGSYVTWYHFRIPIKSYQARRGPINDFRSIRFMRMFLTGFEDSVYFRFATLDLVRSEWRRYERPLVAPGEALTIPEPLESKLTIGSVNIEENSKKDPVNYILPPGVDRVIDPADPQLRQLNEQSIVLKVDNLQEGESKAAYKTSNIDIREYKKLEMFVHAEEVQGYDLNDNELYAFIRLGADYTENYYEYEIPLELTPPGNYQNGNVDSKDREIVWKNRFDINLDDLPELKIERNKKMRQSGSGVDFQTVYSIIKEKAKISVRGNPNLSDVKTIMIGLRNPQDFGNTGRPITAEVWMNELRLSHFREEGGWAANARVTTNLSDFATLDLAGSTVQPGFGSIEKKPNERSKEQIYRADASSNIALGKFFPQKAGIRLPMYLGYSTEIVNPQYNPLEPDVEFKKSLNSIDDEHARDSIRRIAQDRTVRKSINFTNVGISGKGKPKIYSPSNFSFNFAYSEMRSHSITVDTLFEKQYSGGLVYNYNTRPRPVTPFTKMIKSNNLRLIRDFNFNYYPSQLTFRTSLERRYREKKMRNLSYSNVQLPWTVEKNFIWNRDYGFKWDLTRSLKLNYSANNRARIDEEPGRYRKGVDDYQLKKDTIIKNLKNFGRTIQYRHKVSGSYNLPINKIGFLNWTSVNLNYDGTYSWDAGPQFSKAGKAYEGINLGNTINNSNNIQARGNLRLTRLYNKIGFLERINKGRKKNQQELKEVEYKDDGVRLREGRSKNIYHKLGTEDVQVWVTDAKGDEIEGDLEIVNSNRVKFTPESDYNNANIKVVGKVKKGPNLLEFMGRTIARTAMSVRDISVSISRNKGMTVPGYQPKTEYLGMNKNFNAPTVPFILGWVDDDISGFYEQAKNNWLAQDVNVIDPLMVTKTERINIRSNIEPIDGIKISLTANRTYSENNNYYYTYDTLGGFPSFNELPKNIQGNFSMSYMSIGSAFENPNKDNNWHSDAFNNFKKYRKQIADRLAQQRLKEDPTYDDWQNRNYFVHPELQDTIYKDASYPMGYGRQSQEVLIPAFLAAYGDKSPGKITLANFPKWYEILPNWRIRINKLTEIDWIKERFRSVSINHSYSSTYSVGSFINNPEYLGYTTDSSFNMQGDFITKYNINGISLSEQFRPLIGIDMTFENGLNLSTQWQKSRTLSLSFSNNRLTEVLSNEFSVGAGYRFDEVPLILNLGGGDQEAFETNLRINADFGIRKNINILRDLDGSTPEVSRGQEMFTFELSADYALSSRFNLRFFVDRQEVNPFISNTYARKNTNIGFSVTFTLAN
jgi:cell surface protein SprA